MESIRLHLTVCETIDKQLDLYFKNRAIWTTWKSVFYLT